MTSLLQAMGVLLVLFVAAISPVAASAGAADELYDIRGPVRPSGFPPYAVSATIALLAAGVTLSSVVAGKRRKTLPEPESGPVSCRDELLLLREAYLKGELPDQELFDRLSSLLRSISPAANSYSLTHLELFAAARCDLPEDFLDCTEELFELCDRVRFGGRSPGQGVATKALDDALKVVCKLSEIDQ